MSQVKQIRQIKLHTYEKLTTTELVRLSQQNDTAAFKVLLRRQRAYISNRLYKLAPDWKDQSDLIQEINIRVWRFIAKLRKPASFQSWLRQLITNAFYDELRKRPRDVEIVSLDEPVVNDSGEENSRELKDSSKKPEEMLLARELSTVLLNAIKEVPAPFQQAEVLRDLDGLSYEEIAQRTNSELGTVKSRIARARLRIQQRIADYLECA